MEELLETINVRDLLSTSDVNDPTSPLSAPDLRLLISRLESHSLQIKSKVKSYLLSQHPNFLSLFSLSKRAVSISDEASRSVSDLCHSVSRNATDVEIAGLLKEVREKVIASRLKREILDVVRVVSGFYSRLEAVKEGVRSGRLGFGAKELGELKESLRINGSGEMTESEPVVYSLLRQSWHEAFDEIQEVLVSFMDNAVRFEPHSSKVLCVTYRPSVGGITHLDLCTVLEAMEVAGVLDYGLAKVADQMIKFVIAPAVNRKSPTSFNEDLKVISEEVEEATLEIMPSVDPEMEDTDGQVMYDGILRAVKFISKYICFENESWIRCFGRLTWSRISDLIISNFLSKAVPEDAAKLAGFQKIIKNTLEFETMLKEMCFVSSYDKADQKLSNFAENVEVHFASRKKKEILSKARYLLLQCNFTIPREYAKKDPSSNDSEHVVDLLFFSKRCTVSNAAYQLMELVHQTLKDICLSSSRVALEFYLAARDAILLYEVIIPVKLEKQLDSINQVAVLMHNDCLYLSQEILGLAFEYRPDFPSSINEHAVFLDLAPRFHIMAEEVLQRQVQLVIANLKEAIDSADGFQNTHQVQQFESAKFSMDQVVFILEKVRIIWEPLLLPSTYKKCMRLVLESVFSRIAGDILLLDDMAAEETLQLQRLINLMLESLSSLMKSLIIAVQKEKEEEYARSLDDIVPSLRKLQKLAELLDLPLKSITTAWESGELINSGFTASEVQDFIRAIFTDSPLRKECLWRIQHISL